MVVACLLVCEGSSDAPLVSHIQRLLDKFGCHSSVFDVSTSGRRLVDKVRNGLSRASYYDLLFVHRDADRAGVDARYREIDEAVQQSGYGGSWVGIVPVRTTEAWLLLDETAIRNIVRNLNGRIRLNLPSPAEAERLADPKSALRSAMLFAAGVHGRKRRELARELPNLRNRLLENLPIDGLLEQVPSWVRFRDDTVAALQAMSS